MQSHLPLPVASGGQLQMQVARHAEREGGGELARHARIGSNPCTTRDEIVDRADYRQDGEADARQYCYLVYRDARQQRAERSDRGHHQDHEQRLAGRGAQSHVSSSVPRRCSAVR